MPDALQTLLLVPRGGSFRAIAYASALLHVTVFCLLCNQRGMKSADTILVHTEQSKDTPAGQSSASYLLGSDFV